MLQVKINKKNKEITREHLETLSKEELIDKVVQLNAHVKQLKNVLQKTLNGDRRGGNVSGGSDVVAVGDGASIDEPNAPASTEAAVARRERKRKFDFSKCHKRHVLLKLLYFGWDYHGLAVQEDSNATIEHHLFQALTRTCLIESRQTANYHRCGRTDKQVSAFCQVISIDLRSKFPTELQHHEDSLAGEIDYCGMLNRILPKNIQCIAWLPLPNATFSARFDCVGRTYRYYFPKANLNIDAMRAGCKLLVRHADFRNLCKMDVNNGVTNFMRHIESASIRPCAEELTTEVLNSTLDGDDDDGYAMYFMEIKANAFLWHQIRCIMAILLLIGHGNEEPQVIDDLLNVQENPCKPQYTPALALPLNLFHCDFNAEQMQSPPAAASGETVAEQNHTDTSISWVHNESNLERLIETVQQEWLEHSVKCTMARDVLRHLESTLQSTYPAASPVRLQASALQDGNKTKTYQKLLHRKRCESLENRIDHYVKKQRLQLKEQPTSET